MNQEPIDISIVIPLYNSGIRIVRLYQSIVGIIPFYNNYEIIFVDDGSQDNTIEIINDIRKRDQHIHIIQLARNMGQYRALFLGYKYSKGKIVIGLDDDVFEEAAYIPEFIRKIEEGYDIVLGWRKKKEHPFIRRLASYIFNVIISLIIRKRIHDLGSPIKAKNRRVVDKLVSLGELSYLLKYYKYYKVIELELPHKYGKQFPTRYSFVKLMKNALLILKNNIFNVKECCRDNM